MRTFKVINNDGDIECTIWRPETSATMTYPRDEYASRWPDSRTFNVWELISDNEKLESRWNALKQKAIDYRFNKTGSHEDGRYCVAISVTDLLKWMEELEGEK